MSAALLALRREAFSLTGGNYDFYVVSKSIDFHRCDWAGCPPSVAQVLWLAQTWSLVGTTCIIIQSSWSCDAPIREGLTVACEFLTQPHRLAILSRSHLLLTMEQRWDWSFARAADRPLDPAEPSECGFHGHLIAKLLRERNGIEISIHRLAYGLSLSPRLGRPTNYVCMIRL